MDIRLKLGNTTRIKLQFIAPDGAAIDLSDVDRFDVSICPAFGADALSVPVEIVGDGIELFFDAAFTNAATWRRAKYRINAVVGDASVTVVCGVLIIEGCCG